MSHDEIRRRYPKLIRALKHVLIGTESEAVCCIRCYQQGLETCCEAVSHSGLTPADRIKLATSQHVRRAVRFEYLMVQYVKQL